VIDELEGFWKVEIPSPEGGEDWCDDRKRVMYLCCVARRRRRRRRRMRMSMYVQLGNVGSLFDDSLVPCRVESRSWLRQHPLKI